ncbi:MAG: MFS transporter [Spirochaetes bacterium]|nr:MAG: MFS transporter [Spirochaetota bacterium]
MNRKGRMHYAWWIVVSGFFLNLAGIGIIMNCMGVFYKPVIESQGFTRGAFALYFSIAALSMMVVAPFMGKILERRNIRVVMGICTALMSVSFALFSQCTTLAHFYALSVFLGIGSAGTHIIPVSMMITNWFEEKRGLAMGIVFSATGIGGFIFNPFSNWLIEQYGWQTAYLVLGIIVGVCTIPVAVFLVSARPAEKGLAPYGAVAGSPGATADAVPGLTARAALRAPAFWFLAVMILFIAVANMGVLHHIVPYLTDIGVDAGTAASLMSLHMAVLVAGKLVMGDLSDRLGLMRSLLLCIAGLTVSIGLLFGAAMFWIAVLFNVLFGFAISVRTVLPPLMTAACLGPRHFGVIYGFLNVFTTLGTAIGVPLSGYIHDFTKNYHAAFALYIALGVLAAVFGVLALRGAKFARAGH